MTVAVVARSALVKPAYRSAPKHSSIAAAKEAIDLAASAGLILDAEQRLIVETVLAEQGSQWAAFEAAVIEPRQNGKTVALQAIALADLFLFDAWLIVWTAHLFDTAQEAFRDIVALVDGTDHLRAEVKTIHLARGDEGIELTDGRRLNFLARSKTGGRGMSGQRVILDEAFALTPAEMGSLLPTLSAQSNPQVVYASSAGLATSEILRSIRDRGRAGGDPSLAYLEWSAPEVPCVLDDCDHRVGTAGCVLDDPRMWKRANPTMGKRMLQSYVAKERVALPPEEFARERMGWWEDPAEDDIAFLEAWLECADAKAKITDPIVLAVDASPNGASASMVACGANGVLDLIDHRAGTAWLIERVVEVGANRSLAVGMDPSGPIGSMVPDFEKAGFKIRGRDNPDAPLVLLEGRELVRACGAIYAATLEHQLVHRDQPILNDAIAGAYRRPVGDAWKWSRRDSTVDISPLVAATTARCLWAQPDGADEPPEIW